MLVTLSDCFNRLKDNDGDLETSVRSFLFETQGTLIGLLEMLEASDAPLIVEAQRRFFPKAFGLVIATRSDSLSARAKSDLLIHALLDTPVRVLGFALHRESSRKAEMLDRHWQPCAKVEPPSEHPVHNLVLVPDVCMEQMREALNAAKKKKLFKHMIRDKNGVVHKVLYDEVRQQFYEKRSMRPVLSQTDIMSRCDSSASLRSLSSVGEAILRAGDDQGPAISTFLRTQAENHTGAHRPPKPYRAYHAARLSARRLKHCRLTHVNFDFDCTQHVKPT